MRRNYRSKGLLFLMILVGLIVGDVLGQLLARYVPILGFGKRIGLSTTTLDLGIASITFGFDLHLGLAGVIGLIIGVLLYQKIW